MVRCQLTKEAYQTGNLQTPIEHDIVYSGCQSMQDQQASQLAQGVHHLLLLWLLYKLASMESTSSSCLA
jgi:hypothetical protein